VSENNQSCPVLTIAQRRLVSENMGLVGVHLRRNVPDLADPHRKREWEDLFQEGCLGLIKAALAYRPESGIPFAAFALPRIHNAVSRALLTKFTTMYVPPSRIRRTKAPPRRQSPDRPSIGIRRDEEARQAHSLQSPDVPAGWTVQCSTPDAESRPRQTVGERIHEKYARALKQAAETVSKRATTRRDRRTLVQALVEERMLVPEKEARRTLRRIARDTRSSYGRVAECERQLGARVRRTLDADPEFRALRRVSRTDPAGAERCIDKELEERLVAVAAAEFIRRIGSANREHRARLLQRLWELSPDDVEEIVREKFSKLPVDARERLLSDGDG